METAQSDPQTVDLSQEQQYQPAEYQPVEPPPPMEPPQRSSWKSFLFGVLTTIGILCIGVGGYVYYQHAQLKQSASPVIPTPTVTIPARISLTPTSSQQQTNLSILKNSPLVFAQDKELYIASADGSIKTLTNTDHLLYSYDYSEKAGLVVYVTGKKMTNENNFSWIAPDTVSLLSIGGESKKNI